MRRLPQVSLRTSRSPLRYSFGSLKQWGANKCPPSELRGIRVLVVEDQWHVANALKLLLGAEGMETVGPAPTVADARQLAAERKPDVAVVDINLKGEMAYGLIEQLHAQGVRIVVVSGYVLQRLTEKVSAVLHKPVN